MPPVDFTPPIFSHSHTSTCKSLEILAKISRVLGRLVIRSFLPHNQKRHIHTVRSFSTANAVSQQTMLARAAKEQTSGWRSSQPRTLEQALKPASQTATNAAPSAAYKNPLKRTASQASGATQNTTMAALSRSSSGTIRAAQSVRPVLNPHRHAWETAQ